MGLIACVMLVVLAGGLAMVIAGWRGRRVNDHPVCARCRFDLVGMMSDQVRRCPECGADVSRREAIRIGVRRRRPLMLATGTVALLFAAASTGSLTWMSVKGIDMSPHLPTSVLFWQAKLTSGSMRGNAIVELGTRASAGGLSDDQIKRLVLDTLGIRIRLRPRVSSGEAWAYSFDFAPTELRNQVLWIGVDSFRVGTNDFSGPGFAGGIGGTLGRMTSSSAPMPALEPGRYDASINFCFGFLKTGALVVPPKTGARTAPGKWVHSVSTPIEILAPDQSSVALVRDESVRAAITQCISIRNVQLNYWTFNVDRSPRNLAFRAFLRHGDWERELGQFACPAHMHWGTTIDPKPGMRLGDPSYIVPPPYEVVLRPSPAAAEATVDITEIWDGEIVIPVTRGSP